jgi:hypothetical protein
MLFICLSIELRACLKIEFGKIHKRSNIILVMIKMVRFVKELLHQPASIISMSVAII